MHKADEYRVNSILDEVLAEAIDYVRGLSESFQKFYASFDARIAKVDRRIANIAKKYEHSKGTTARYVCASSACLQAMTDEFRYAGGTISIDSRLAEDIYNRGPAVIPCWKNGRRMEATLMRFLKQGIMGYFQNSLMEVYGQSVDMDIIEALEEEAKYEEEMYNSADVEQYVKKVIRSTRAAFLSVY